MAPTDRPYPTLMEYRYWTCVRGTSTSEETAVRAMSPLQLEDAEEVKADVMTHDAAAKALAIVVDDGNTAIAALAAAGGPPPARADGESCSTGGANLVVNSSDALLLFSASRPVVLANFTKDESRERLSDSAR
jgi:hypothetical protein